VAAFVLLVTRRYAPARATSALAVTAILYVLFQRSAPSPGPSASSAEGATRT
jgi:hypothetical protein